MDLTNVSLSLIRLLGVQDRTACLGDCHLGYSIPSRVGWVSLFTAGASSHFTVVRVDFFQMRTELLAVRAHRIFI